MTRTFPGLLLLFLSTMLPAWAGESRFTISLDAVTRAVVAAHPEVAIAEVRLPASIVSRLAAPTLAVGRLEPSGSPASSDTEPRAARVRLNCEGDAVCLPFYATVLLARGATLPRGESGTPARLSPSLAAEASGAQRTASPLPALRSGARAQMLIDSGHLHLRFPVTCLEAGAPGVTIRVRGQAAGLVYQAAVIDGATVRGTL